MFSVYHKSTQKDNLPLALPIQRRDDLELKRKARIKFLRALLDENLTQKDHINTIKNKISKNIGLKFGVKNLLPHSQPMFHSIPSERSFSDVFRGCSSATLVENGLSKDSLTKLYYSYIHCYLNYTNMTWASTDKTNLLNSFMTEVVII